MEDMIALSSGKAKNSNEYSNERPVFISLPFLSSLLTSIRKANVEMVDEVFAKKNEVAKERSVFIPEPFLSSLLTSNVDVVDEIFGQRRDPV